MPREQSATLTAIFEAGSYSRRETLDLYLADGTVLPLSRGAVTRVIGGVPVVYKDSIRQIGELTSTVDKSIDRITVECQNVDSILGLNLANGSRLLDYAFADYGKVYQSNLNPALTEDIPRVFPGIVANADVKTTRIVFDLIVDYEALWRTVSSRSLSPKCDAVYKDGINCTSLSIHSDCPKTRLACGKRGRLWENMGWEFFEEPTTDAPGSGTNISGSFSGNNPYGGFINQSGYTIYEN